MTHPFLQTCADAIVWSDIDYRAFLEAKAPIAQAAGLPCSLDDVPTHLKTGEEIKPHQRAIIRWAVEGGRRALFEAFGLGKSIQQLLILDIIIEKVEQLRIEQKAPVCPNMGLIVAPLGVRREFIADAKKLGLPLHFVKSDAEIDAIGDDCGLYLTNYESVRDGKIDVSRFTVVSLDEASILRSFGSKTFQEFLPRFASVPYRFVATATPSPNRYKELIHYAGFLGVMDTGQALTRFFQRNSEKANDLNLYPHKEDEFWLWMNSWAVFLQKPSDLGFSDEGYDLPLLTIRWHEVKTDIAGEGVDKFGQAALFRDKAVGVVGASREKRRTLDQRIAKVAEIIDEDPDAHYLLWHDLEDERKALQKLDGVEAVFGTQKLDDREGIIERFADGRLARLAAKPVMLGSGTNLQRHCHRAIFAGVGFKFNDFIQAIHRLHRFLQPKAVVIDIIYAETEDQVRRELLAKWERDDEMKARMSEIIRKYGLNHAAAADAMKRSIGVERTETTGAGWKLAHNDCVEEARLLDEGSLDLIVTSIPFSNHYEYTPSYNDFGHTDDDAHFFAQLDFLTPELLRALAPGRMACIHVKDRIMFGNVTGEGVPTVNPFHAKCIEHYLRHGFQYMGMIHVNTDVVRENNQTYRLSYSEMLKDGTKMGVGSPEYVLLMRKPQSDQSRGYADTPVRNSRPDYMDADGNVVPYDANDRALRPVPGTGYSLARWQIDANPFWRSSGERLAQPAELRDAAQQYGEMEVGALVKAFTVGSRDQVYDFDAHVAIGESIEARDANDMRGHLPRTFSSLAPGATDPNTWDDVVRMHTLNAEQVAKGREKHVCLARGSRVLTRERGYVPIEDVVVGEHTLTHMGRWRPVEVVACTGIQPVITIRAQGVPGLTVTPDHKLWTRKTAWARERDGAERATPMWMEAQDTLGGYVNFRLPPVEEREYEGDALTWWIVGRWLADGHFGSRGDIHISCGHHEVEELRLKLGDRWGTSRHTDTAVQVRIRTRGTPLRNILSRCGVGAAGKQLPPEAFTLDEECAGELLGGYLSGDGHFVAARTRWMASSVSRNLLLGVAMLAQRVFGTIASIYPGREDRVEEIEGREVNCRQEWGLSFDTSATGSRKKPFIIDDGAWKKVRALEDGGEAETWCLRVAEDASFTAEGCIVKNCPLQFDIVDRLIERYSMAGELVYDPFCGLGTVPMRAVLKKRRGAGSELNPDYYRHSLLYLQEAEREASVPTLFGLLGLEDAA